jgi:TolB-like protein
VADGSGDASGGATGVKPGALTALLQEVAATPEPREAEPPSLPCGTVIGRFEILRELGHGGFGVVYEARDRDLGRQVAVKVVRPGSIPDVEGKVSREAEAIARLSHPNLITLFEVGRSEHGPFLVFELLRGRTLQERMEDGPMPVQEAVHIATEVARGLAHAHGQGVLHRDLKPANVFVTTRGQVKILDFGMAHAFGRRRLSGGTPAYMAPEQWADDPEDERTDVFALGVMLYRMLTGEYPFPEDGGRWASGPAGAPGLDLPGVPRLAELVGRMLAMAPRERIRDGAAVLEALAPVEEGLRTLPAEGKSALMEDLARELGGRGGAAASPPPARGPTDSPDASPDSRSAVLQERRRLGVLLLWVGFLVAAPGVAWYAWTRESGQRTPPPASPPSIAVLPFANMTGDSKQGYFADGFTEQIITSLSKVPELRVISRTSTFTYKGKVATVQQVGQELGVRYVLEGSVQAIGSRIRVNAQLIDATSGQHVWADSYDRELKDIFALQDDLILKILTALQVKLTAGEDAHQWTRGTPSLEAYLKGMQAASYVWQGTPESLALARRAAEETIALDPDYPRGYALLGAAYLFEVYVGARRPEESIAKAIELTQKALAMDGSMVAAHSTLGLLYCFAGRHDEGIVEAERGVELEPSSGGAFNTLGMVLRYSGRPGEALASFQKTLRLEPMAPDLYFRQVALSHFMLGDCREAIATGDNGPRRQPDNLNSHAIMAIIYGGCGKVEDARKEAMEVLRINPKFTVDSYTAILPYRQRSDRDRLAQGLRSAGLP